MDAYREGLLFSGGTPKGDDAFLLARGDNLEDPRSAFGLRNSKLRRDDSTEASRREAAARYLRFEGRACVVTSPRAIFAPRCEDLGQAVALALGKKKQACSDWDRRKWRTAKEGADAVGPGAGLISTNKHEANLLYACSKKKDLLYSKEGMQKITVAFDTRGSPEANCLKD